MNSPFSNPSTGLEPGWKSYLKATVFILPALIFWSIASVFFAPKLQQIWQQGGGPAGDAQWVMEIVLFLVRHGGVMGGALLLGALALELRPNRWARYRRLALASLVLVLNSTIVTGLWCMCLAALLVAPAVSHAK